MAIRVQNINLYKQRGSSHLEGKEKNKTLMNGHKLYNKIHYEGKDEKITSSRKKIGR